MCISHLNKMNETCDNVCEDRSAVRLLVSVVQRKSRLRNLKSCFTFSDAGPKEYFNNVIRIQATAVFV